MKYTNTIFALAALTLAANASAQSSSVSLFGVMDASVVRLSSDTNSVTGLSSGGLSSSRLGFRGVEDLGGGLKIGFWLEGGIPADNGGSGFKFDRRSTTSLMGSFGEVRVGRDKTPSYLNIETFDALGDAGVGGIDGANLLAGASSAPGTSEGSGPKRMSNSIGYISPKFSGFSAQAQYGFGETAGSNRMGSFMALRLAYDNGPLAVAGAYGVTRGGTEGADVDYKVGNIGASYNFGMVKPMVLFATERADGKRVDAYSIGATMPLGAGELRASFAQISRKDLDDADTKRYAIGYTYNLSKRTAVYAALARISNEKGAKRGFALSSSSLKGPTIAAGDKATGYEIGLRHSF